ncbi:SDR family NAD(P)-dependent oxidoreductase [Nocardioides marmoribigeumensis]|uniref:NAD(P)-dependent dehydrogenase (Short-subunit alcohol dehydrogenase family) n=1 Tax=Nocardioides marmoribigeumensis TaxID=433649 RepID=A0ABU2C1A9_9ACTN|nr:SDR family NAD(P)-dependent oxidoreductase [Nocardioides marmoribigeumensis]MDR7364374.1 NAD(P)-dependent dehydrogenase (short-subunit alcohol dehydrogenase family) [Nocardioides marmoribigeumensis]
MSVVVVGAGSAAGRAVVDALLASGHSVAAVDLRSPEIEGTSSYAVDATDHAAVDAVAAELRAGGPVTGLVHLIGGWRGGKGFTDNSDADWDFLSSMLIDTLRHTTRAFHDDLVASQGRVVIVSAAAAGKPTAGNANYATAKAAAEAWMQALAHSFGDSGAAAVTLVVKALLTPQMREESPEKKFPGYTDVADLGAAVAETVGGAHGNGERVVLGS